MTSMPNWTSPGDAAQELGRLAEGGSNLDQLGGAGAGSLRAKNGGDLDQLALYRVRVLDVAQALLGEHCGATTHRRL